MFGKDKKTRKKNEAKRNITRNKNSVVYWLKKNLTQKKNFNHLLTTAISFILLCRTALINDSQNESDMSQYPSI